LQFAAAAAQSANGPPTLPTQPVQSANSLTENPKQGLRQNPTQQPHAASAANAAYPVGPLGDPPALPARRRLLADQDSFAPIGIDAGSFLLRPAVEMIGGYDSNPARSATGKAFWYAVLAQSCWSIPTGRGMRSAPICAAATPTIRMRQTSTGRALMPRSTGAST